MNTLHREWTCVCNAGDPVFHAHYDNGRHQCARGCGCDHYRPAIPEAAAIRMLLGPPGPVMTEREAQRVLLGP